MKTNSICRLATALSCVGMLVSPSAMAASSANSPRDVALQQGGVLVGQVVDAQGAAQAQTPVSIRAAGEEVIRVETDRLGKFTAARLQGGVYEVASVGHQQTYRLWAPQTAPPAAQRGLMIVSSSDLIRGQGCGSGVSCGSGVNCGTACGSSCGGFGGGGGPLQWMANHPIITAGAVAAAVAIPLALDDDDPATP